MKNTDSAAINALRSHIDIIDDKLHDLLVERFAVVGQIGALKAEGGLALRPGREAQILRRLIARHVSTMPRATVARIWREILGSFTSAQSPLAVAVADGGGIAGLTELARDHFGKVPPLRLVASGGQVVKLVADNVASVGVVPLPGVGAKAGADPWWAALTSESAPRIVTRLPFFPYDSLEPVHGLVIAKLPHDDTGLDRTYLILETTAATSRDRVRDLAERAGFMVTDLPASVRIGEIQVHLVEVNGWVGPSDPRINEVRRDSVSHVTIAGGYPVPLTP